MGHPLRTAAICLFVSVFFMAGCEQPDEPTESGKQGPREHQAEPKTESKKIRPAPDPEWPRFLFQHTSGTVSRESDIEIRFSRDAIPAERLDEDWSDAVSVEPVLDGELVVDSVRKLRVVPTDSLAAGIRYEVTINATALPGLPDTLGDYRFKFDTIVPDFELRVDGVTIDDETAHTVAIEGVLITADVAADSQVEQILSARYRDEDIDIDWKHLKDQRHHVFTIDGLTRPKQAASLTLRWDGGPLDADRTGEREIEIPRRDIFKVTDVTVDEDARQQVNVRFSDTLDENQNLDGLVAIKDANVNTRVSGNEITIHVREEVTGERTLVLSPGIRSKDGARLENRQEWPLAFSGTPPKVRFASSGVILPAGAHLELPFEVINADSVQVTAFRVYQDNIGQFLQHNDLNQSRSLGRVGRHLWRKTIELPDARPDQWERYSLDLSDLADRHPGALFRITLSLNRGNALIDCGAEAKNTPVKPENPPTNRNSRREREPLSWDFAEEWYAAGNTRTDYANRNDPCKDAYYHWRRNDTTDARNFLASNIGLLAKAGNDGSFVALATNLRTGEPLADVSIDVRNYQDQTIDTLTTDDDGLVTAELDAVPFYLLAKHDGDYGYLKVNRGSALPTSHFDAGGETVEAGVKGRIYGERGVWRPGDALHLTFALHDPEDAIPDGHPATLQLITPKGQVFATRTNDDPMHGFYRFDLRTAADAQTGEWTARVLVGDRRFDRTVKIETVKPNRLAIEVTPEKDVLKADGKPIPFTFRSHWLHGAKASGLKADVKAHFAPADTTFSSFTGYEFDDPVREFSSGETTLWEGKLDEEGVAEFTADIDLPSKPAGRLQAYLTSRVFESGGAFSVGRQALPLHAFNRYVGLQLPESDRGQNRLRTDTEYAARIATLSAEGEPVDVSDIEVEIFKLNWRWWWDRSADAVTRFSSRRHHDSVQEGTVATRNGRGEWTFTMESGRWGRYLLRACDTEGGHCTGQVFYLGWSGATGDQSGPAASVLLLNADREKYEVGDTAVLKVPDGLKGRALLTLETGSGILSERWLTFDGGANQTVDIPVTEGMAPNVYAAVTHIQPHAGRDNDRPMRLYGVVPLKVTDPATRLAPVVEAADTWRPRSEQRVTVSESNGRPMTYTLAVVDEGLLGLTGFDTPSLHDTFYRREALGVLTWDLFDQVVGAYGADLERLLALGGSDAGETDPRKEKERRFPPVVRFQGPYRLAPGETREHDVELPQYVGAVRVIAVAGDGAAYGSTDKTVTVREPLSALVTLPRVLGPGEELDVPVSVFAYEENIESAEVRLELGEGLELAGDEVKTVTFDEGREVMTRFRVKVAERLGKTKVTAIASSDDKESRTETFIDVRAASQPETRTTMKRLEPGESWQHDLAVHGMAGTNDAGLSLSSVPPFGLDHRLNHLVRYPYGCVEQLTSAAFPQVYLPQLAKLPPETLEEAEANVHAALNRLRSYQNADGGFSYWPGLSHYQAWSDTWAGHFLIEANRLGYKVPAEMRADWLQHAREKAASWTTGNKSSTLTQAYRLYVLALGNNAQLSAMNRLREAGELEAPANWMLAAAYSHIGLRDAADQLLAGRLAVDYGYDRAGPTFGSRLRDRAILLSALATDERNEAAMQLAERIAADLRTERWYSTQSLGFGMSALGRFVSGDADTPSLSAGIAEGDGETEPLVSERPMARVPLVAEDGRTVTVRNDGQRPLWATVAVEGTPPPGDEQPLQGELALDVVFTDESGDTVNPRELDQGTDVIATVDVANRSGGDLEQLALKYVVPSGWEIANERLAGGSDAEYDYLDIRDDRVFTHFGLEDGESRTYRFRFTATYAGEFYAPGIVFEDMYDASLTSRTAGQWVTVAE